MSYTMSEAAHESRCKGARTNRNRKKIHKRTCASLDKSLAEKAKSFFGSVANAVEFAVQTKEKSHD